MNTTTATNFDTVWKEAYEAGIAAGEAALPTPMNVTRADPTTGKPVPGATVYHVPEGACGFAWVTIYAKGDNRKFVNWLKKAGHARAAYPAGFWIWISEFGQSVERKAAMARAMAKVFKAYGFECYAQSRLD